MSKLPVATGKQLLRVLVGTRVRCRPHPGQSSFLRHPDGRTPTVPVHGKETPGPGLLGKILRDTEMTREE